MPSVSIIIPTHNRVGLLKRAVESARTAGEDVEVVVVDDASTDGTQVHCRSIDWIKYVRLDQNQRTAGARNAGIAASRAEYVSFLDDDDLRIPGSIDRQLEVIRQNRSYGVVYGQTSFAGPSGEILDDPPTPAIPHDGDVFANLIKRNFIGLSTSLVRKSIFDSVGLFDTSRGMYGIEDWDMWLRISEHFAFGVLFEPVAVYRKPQRDTQQWSSDIPAQFSRVANAYRNKWLKLPKAKALLDAGTVSRNELLNSVADQILYDMATNSKGLAEMCNKSFTAIRCHPHKLRQLTFYKTLARAVVEAR